MERNKSINTALVTGAASGLGLELSILLAKDSYDLILIDIDESNLKLAKEQIENDCTVEISLLVKDLSQTNIASEIFKELKGKPIDILVIMLVLVYSDHSQKLNGNVSWKCYNFI